MTLTPWGSVAPMLPGAFVPTIRTRCPIDLGNGITFTTLDPRFTRTPITDELSGFQKRFLQTAQYALVSSPPPSAPQESEGETSTNPVVETPFQRLVSANLAMWLAKPSAASMSLVMIIERNEMVAVGHDQGLVMNGWIQPDPLAPHENDLYQQLTEDDLAATRELNIALWNVPRGTATRIAIRTLWSALTETTWEQRYLLLWIALEALFGPEDGREITYRLSQRLGFFIGGSRADARQIFKSAIKAYGWRSKVAHGIRLKKLEEAQSVSLTYEAEGFIRSALRRILTEDCGRFFSTLEREGYLDDLTFS